MENNNQSFPDFYVRVKCYANVNVLEFPECGVIARWASLFVENGSSHVTLVMSDIDDVLPIFTLRCQRSVTNIHFMTLYISE